jgi:hypothetical protein
VRRGEYKLIEFFEAGRLELYHLPGDIQEKHNLAQEQPERAQELHALLLAWRDQVGALLPQPNPDWVTVYTMNPLAGNRAILPVVSVIRIIQSDAEVYRTQRGIQPAYQIPRRYVMVFHRLPWMAGSGETNLGWQQPGWLHWLVEPEPAFACKGKISCAPMTRA